eukprot:6141686-Alexandrium_andersonii.AAC.1
MSASLVGSEMCIRDSSRAGHGAAGRPGQRHLRDTRVARPVRTQGGLALRRRGAPGHPCHRWPCVAERRGFVLFWESITGCLWAGAREAPPGQFQNPLFVVASNLQDLSLIHI